MTISKEDLEAFRQVLREELGVDTDVGVVSSADVASSVGQASSLAADDPSEPELESGRSSERRSTTESTATSRSPPACPCRTAGRRTRRTQTTGGRQEAELAEVAEQAGG